MLVKVRLVKNFENIYFNFNDNFILDEILLKLIEFSENKEPLEFIKDWNDELINIKEEEDEINIKNNYLGCFDELLNNINYIELMNDEDEEDEDEFYDEKFTIYELIESYYKEGECILLH